MIRRLLSYVLLFCIVPLVATFLVPDVGVDIRLNIYLYTVLGALAWFYSLLAFAWMKNKNRNFFANLMIAFSGVSFMFKILTSIVAGVIVCGYFGWPTIIVVLYMIGEWCLYIAMLKIDFLDVF